MPSDASRSRFERPRVCAGAERVVPPTRDIPEHMDKAARASFLRIATRGQVEAVHGYAVFALGVLNWTDFHKLKTDLTHTDPDAVRL